MTKKKHDIKAVDDLEAKFEQAVAAFHKELSPIQDEITKLIGKAEELSEKHGIPFAGVGPLTMNFIPESYVATYKEGLDADFVSDTCDVYVGDAEYVYSGWEHSQIC